jgi:hypothetical protein
MDVVYVSACLLTMLGTVSLMAGLSRHDRRMAHQQDARRALRKRVMAL